MFFSQDADTPRILELRIPEGATVHQGGQRLMYEVPAGTFAGKDFIYSASMEKKPKYVARIDNVYFINGVGASLREATSHVIMEELPENIRLLLRRLKRMEVRAKSRKTE